MALDPSIILQQKSPLDVQREMVQTNLAKQEYQQNQQMNPLRVQQARQALESGQLEQLQKKNEMVNQVLFGVTDEDTYQRAKQWAVSNGLDVSRLPQNYDPGVIQQLRMSSMTTAQYLNNMYKMANLDLQSAKAFGSPEAGMQAMAQMGHGMGGGMPAQMSPPMQGPMQNGQTVQGAMQGTPLQTINAQKLDLARQNFDLRKQQFNNPSQLRLFAAYQQMTPDQQQAYNQFKSNQTSRMDDATKDRFAVAIANGQMAVPSSFALKDPDWKDVMGRVLQKNPGFDSNMNRNMAEWERGKLGNTVRSFNVLTQHLGTMRELAQALQNGDMQAINRAGNALSAWTGSAAPTDFNAAKQLISQEIIKAVSGAAGALGDREEAERNLSMVNSPEQLAGVLDTYTQLAGGQLAGLRQQYQVGTQRNDFDHLLTPAAQATFEGKSSAPKAGDTMDGYIFNGGDPSDKNNWRKVQ